jgi:hypothetical protein
MGGLDAAGSSRIRAPNQEPVLDPGTGGSPDDEADEERADEDAGEDTAPDVEISAARVEISVTQIA